MAQVTINGGGGTYLQTPMYTGLTLGTNEYPKGTVTFSLSGGWFFLNSGRSSESYTFTLNVCDQDGYNTIELGTFTINGMSSAVGITFTVSTDKPGLKGKGIYIKTTGQREPSWIRLNNAATLTMATVTNDYSITTSAGNNGTLRASKSSAAAGEQITLTPTAEEGYQLDKYTVTPNTVTITNNKFTMPASNVSVSASFKKRTYTITTSAGDGGSLTSDKATANMGETVTLTPSANAGYQLKTLQTNPARTITNNKFTMPAGNVTATATFSKIQYSVNASAGTGGTLTASKGTATVGDEITLKRTAATGYQFDKYTVTPNTVTITNNKFTMPAGNVTVTASFKKISYSITTSAGDGGSLTSDKATANMGETVTLKPTANTGYRLNTLQTNPARTITNNKFTMPAENVTATATFSKIQYSVNASAGTGGTLTASKGTATVGDEITLKRTAATGYQFDKYTVTPNTVTITNNKFTMPAGNVTVTATFEKISYSIAVATATGGSVTASKAAATMGEQITLKPIANTGYKLNQITTSPACTISNNKFIMPASDVTVTPSFSKISYTVTVKAGTGGSLTASRSTATYGQSVTLRPTAQSGYQFAGYSSSPTVTITSDAFSMPAGNVTITATFEKITYTVGKAVNPAGTGTVTISRTSATKGDVITLTQTPKSGYHFTGWTSSPAMAISEDKFTMPAEDVTVTGNFAQTVYTITRKVSPAGAGTLLATKASAYKGDTVELTPSANTGYQFLNYTKSPSSLTISNDEFTMPAANVTITANFIRRSTATLSSKSMSGGGSVKLTISSESAAYTHKYKLSFGTGMETSLTNVAAGTSEVTINIPEDWTDAVPNATSKSGGTLTLYTYRNGSQVASAYTITGLTYNVPESVKPSIHSVMIACIKQYDGHDYSGITGNYYIQNHCKARIGSTAVGARGSTIESYTLRMSGYTGNSYNATIIPATQTTSYTMDFTTGVLFLSGMTKITLTVKDSRGRTYTVTSNVTVSEYSQPGGTLTVDRVNANREPDDFGTYAVYAITKRYTQIGNNSLTATLKYSSYTAENPADTGDLMPGSRKTFNVDQEYTIQLILQDALETVTITEKLGTARYIIYVDGTGNKIGFMKKPNKAIPAGKERTFEIAEDAQVYIGDSTLETFIWNRIFRNILCSEGTTNIYIANNTRARIDFITNNSTRVGSVLIYASGDGTIATMQENTGSNITLTKTTNTLTVTMAGGGARAFCTVYTGDISTTPLT